VSEAIAQLLERSTQSIQSYQEKFKKGRSIFSSKNREIVAFMMVYAGYYGFSLLST